MKAVIFDMDGVIFDSERAVYNEWKEIADKYGFQNLDTVYQKCIGVNAAKAKELFLEFYGPDFPYETYREEESRKYHAKYDNGNLPVKKGVRELLSALKENGFFVAIASSTRQAVIEHQIEHAGLMRYFDRIVGGEAVQKSKPAPDIFLAAAQGLDGPLSDIFVVEDSYNGIRAAKSAGMRPVMVPDMLSPDDEMREKAEFIAEDLLAVRALLEKEGLLKKTQNDDCGTTEAVNDAGEAVHKRRVRYSGTHPKNFSEKYKEQNPEKYADTVAKVIAKGSTPAGMHISIMVREVLDALRIRPGQKGLDATLGYGGHSTKMLEQLNHTGHLYSLDVDSIEIEKTKERIAKAGFTGNDFTAIRENFANIEKIAKEYGPFDFMMADLGVSSMQIDNPERGFSYKLDGPLDLRLDQKSGVPAGERINQMKKDEIIGMLVENSDEPYAEKIAAEIMKNRKKKILLTTTKDLYNCIVSAISFLPDNPEKKELLKKTCQRVFQAVRIDVNSEFEVLEAFLTGLPQALAPGGRVAILTFHSGEDRLVKKAFQEYYRSGVFSEITKDVIRPGAEECMRNPRAKSTKLRYAVKAK